mmetsp:Transcript_35662/g.89984  ORF Transcript_35662/g.89984 Transcript_35662/m.89984 type:complete len:92 (+) Transcript_35662:1605-1880(+)
MRSSQMRGGNAQKRLIIVHQLQHTRLRDAQLPRKIGTALFCLLSFATVRPLVLDTRGHLGLSNIQFERDQNQTKFLYKLLVFVNRVFGYCF